MTDYLKCVGGPMDGRTVSVPTGGQIYQAYKHQILPMNVSAEDTGKPIPCSEEEFAELVTYRRQGNHLVAESEDND